MVCIRQRVQDAICHRRLRFFLRDLLSASNFADDCGRLLFESEGFRLLKRFLGVTCRQSFDGAWRNILTEKDWLFRPIQSCSCFLCRIGLIALDILENFFLMNHDSILGFAEWRVVRF